MTDTTQTAGETSAATQTQAPPAATNPAQTPAPQTAASAPVSPAEGQQAQTGTQAPPAPAAPADARTDRQAPTPDEGSEPSDLEGWRRYTRRLSRENADRRKELASVTSERDAATAELTALKVNAQRAAIAADVGLRPELADRIRGDTEAAMRDDAERLREMTDPVGNLGIRQGGTGTAPAGKSGDMDRLLRSAAGRQTS